MKDFFEFIFGTEGKGYLCVTRTTRVGEDDVPNRDKYFSYPEELDEMVKYCTRYSHESIYFVPNLLSEKNRRKPAVSYGTCAFGDADLFPIADFRVAPSLVVQTSPTKTHTYWKITDSVDPIEIERVSHAISQAHDKATTDYDNGWSSVKLLRVPGTTHLKDASKPHKITYEVTGAVYSMEEIAAAYPLPEAGAVIDSKMPENIPSREDAMMQIRWTPEIGEIITGEYKKDTERFRALHLAQHELFRAGATNEVAFAILLDSGLHKWAADKVSEPHQRLWEDIQRARAQSELVSADEATPLAVEAPKTATKYERVDFLTEDERKLIEPTFVDEFVAWGQSKTKTSPAFHVAGGFAILSTVFADFGYLPMDYGEERLNLWIMPSGQSTVDRKTTVLNQMLRVLRDLGREGIYDYEIGSDFTVNALSDVLLDSPNRSGIVHVDEFQGFLLELGKNYMAGTKEGMTAMYSGWIKGKLRSTAAVKRRQGVPYSLSFYAMGINKQIAANLSREDFLSGFLTRFIYVSPADDWTPPNIAEGFNLAPKVQRQGGDDAYNAIVSRVFNARKKWEEIQNPEEPAMPVDVSQAAHDRIYQFIQDTNREVKVSGKEELESTVFRLCVSVYKCAALLSMVDISPRVELKHVLAAINYAGDWYMNILRMVDLISESTWVSSQEAIVDVLIANGSTMDAQKLYSKFSDEYKPRDYAEIIKALENADKIQMVPNGKTRMNVNYIWSSDE